MPTEEPWSPCQCLYNSQQKHHALALKHGPHNPAPQHVQLPTQGRVTHIHSTGTAPELPSSPCSQEHVLHRAGEEVSFWGRGERE